MIFKIKQVRVIYFMKILTSLGSAVADIDLHNRLKSNLLIKRTPIILYLFK